MELVIQEKELRKPLGVIFDLGGTVLRQERFDPVAGNRRLLQFAASTHGLTAEAVQAVADDLSQRLSFFATSITSSSACRRSRDCFTRHLE